MSLLRDTKITYYFKKIRPFLANSFFFSKGLAQIAATILWDNNQPETQIAVAGVGDVVDAIRGAAVPSEVEPTTAAKHAAGAR